MTHVRQPDGRMSSYPPPERWDDWVEWESTAWPDKRRTSLHLGAHHLLQLRIRLRAPGLRRQARPWRVRKLEGNPKPIQGAAVATAPRARPRTTSCMTPSASCTRSSAWANARRGQVEAGELGRGTRATSPPRWRRLVARNGATESCTTWGGLARGPLRQPLHPGVGSRRSQLPHQRLLCVLAHRVLPVGRLRPSQPRLRPRTHHPPHLEPPRDGALLQPACPTNHGGEAGGRHTYHLRSSASPTPPPSLTCGSPPGRARKPGCSWRLRNHLLVTKQYNRDFVRRWVDWQGFARLAPTRH